MKYIFKGLYEIVVAVLGAEQHTHTQTHTVHTHTHTDKQTQTTEI